MNLHRMLRQRSHNPLRIGLIGAGKFGTMYLARARRTPGVALVAVADLAPQRARAALVRCGWSADLVQAASCAGALDGGAVCCMQDALEMIAAPGIDIVIDATGSPAAGMAHVLACCAHGKHIIMVNVEADALAGPLLAQKAREAGIVYSLAYGDQPALICELVDWARTCGLEVVAAGKGTRYLPGYHQSTPDSVWAHYGFSPEEVAAGDFNAQMFNSFVDGSKSAIEMASVANATGLLPASGGLQFPPCAAQDLAHVLRPQAEGGMLERRGQVEVVSSLERDGRPVPGDLRWGVFVAFAADSDYVRQCFRQYGLVTDASGNYSALYRPSHLIGLELGVSVASVGLRGEPTGAPVAWHADVVATAKRDLKVGDVLDGEGGYTVFGRLMPARDSLAAGCLPLGLAHRLRLKRAVPAMQVVRQEDVELDPASLPVRLRREMERTFGERPFGAAD